MSVSDPASDVAIDALQDAVDASIVADHAALVRAHWWVAFGVFGVAVLLGLFQMLHRSNLLFGLAIDPVYYASVTAHGVGMAYVFTTFFAMGLGYFTLDTDTGTADDPDSHGHSVLWGAVAAWPAFMLAVAGAIICLFPVALGRASVLYTFYPPLQAHPAFYIGLAMVVVGSWVWAVLMIVSAVRRCTEIKRTHGAALLPLPVFAVAMLAVVWLWASAGMMVEIGLLALPLSLGLTDTIDASLARTLYSWTLHAIVYFWLAPAYITLYCLLPRAAGGRLFSDEAARIAFVLILIFALPVGFHHLYADPEHGAGMKLLHAMLTFVVVAPTLLTIFTVVASAEVGGRLRGGTGTFGWIRALDWSEPTVLAAGLALVMLGLGGLTGVINASYGLNAMIHNTSWVTAHFHLILGGATVVLYFAAAYAAWPALTGRKLASRRLASFQIAAWSFGIVVMTVPWHALGLLGQPRRWARFDIEGPFPDRWQPWMDVSSFGAIVTTAAGLLFVFILIRSTRGERLPQGLVFRWSTPLKTPFPHPLLDSILLWNGLIAVLMALAYGEPIWRGFESAAGSLGWTP